MPYNPDGDGYRAGGGFQRDANNSTTTPLAASAVFTGTARDILGFNQVHVSLKMSPNVNPDGDANTAHGSLSVQFSPDGENWDIQVPLYVRSGIFIPQTYVAVDRYFRIVYTNDGGASAITNLGLTETADTARNQTAFRLNTYLLCTSTKELGRTIDQTVSGSDPVSLTRSVLMGQQVSDASTYLNVLASDDKELFTTSSESDSNVFASLNSGSITSTTYGILVDLSDTTNYPHDKTGRIDISYLRVAVDPASNSVGDVMIGVIDRIDGTDADITYAFTIPFGKSPARILSINNFSPSQMKMGTSSGAPVFFVSDQADTDNTAVNTGVTFADSRGSTVTPAVGDIIVKFLHTSGNAWESQVHCAYHSHTSAT